MNSRSKAKTKFVNALMDRTECQILLIQAGPGLGKSHLLNDLKREAKQFDANVTTIHVDFYYHRFHSTKALVRYLKATLGSVCFKRLKLAPAKVKQLFNNKIVLLFDTYELLNNNSSKHWIEDNLLPQLKDLPNVHVVIAGRQVPSIQPECKNYSVKFTLKPLNRKEIEAFLSTMNKFSNPDKELIANASRGNPLLLGIIANGLEKGLLSSEELATMAKDPAAVLAHRISRAPQADNLNQKILEMIYLKGRFPDKESIPRDEVRNLIFMKKDSELLNKNILLHDEMRALVKKYLCPSSDGSIDQSVAEDFKIKKVIKRC